MGVSSIASLSAVQQWCRAFRHGLGAGVSLTRILSQQAEKGPAKLRPIAARLLPRIDAGESLTDALAPEKQAFPPMFLDLISIGEQTGHLPEIARELEEYFQLQVQLRRNFYQKITWPVFQFVAAIGIIAGLYVILGIIAESNQSQPMDPLGLGVTGIPGAILFLSFVGGGIAALVAGYWLLTRGMRGRVWLEQTLLRIPGVGPCLEAIALQRFCLAMHLTLNTGIRVDQALRRSLRASGNAVFQSQEETLAKGVRKGNPLTKVLSKAAGFPPEFVDIVQVGEESGDLPEVLQRQSEHYREEATRRLTGLTQSASFGVWLFVAILMIVAIFRMANLYLGALGQFAG
ncbi:type II secretion system F family protein [Tuwongella immobilis]|uniref:Type II secretion system protein GspF domain-containing protein n=1 Tax=Tuwongella immobilis TaxID=692036 RepID=A0A6C2YGK4_9BACT|nr:type II secretion system F family protein [Tuwongella immobilis]VIP00628.1 Type II secretion system protein OS=Planctomyces limnophilus (strain ATCC 43296 / DSM 3776 / IFAM 1008 / 290) GN=Plim_1294 PE=4 SV=1: T2SF: T2SF [Tuwongella immobilis]VTR96674.1 Type II secretion system protein OS=Planctomyces limnophilus (strain ATCC 43296 / DSM 3776 / IFAM 1008 / 290) GN=Plim_1294 PE=4 SV=1: T2SF: T2SF [Tuwongella immobilis]